MKDETHQLYSKFKDTEDVWECLQDDEEMLESIEIFTKNKYFK